MKYRAYFDIADNDKKHFKGSSPNLLDHLIKELQGAKEVWISFFLYNNPSLHFALEKLAEQGCKVKIYSLPLQGYDSRKLPIYKKNYSEKIYSSKSEYAKKIYERINLVDNIQLKIFPHTYVWYKQKFSRGKEAYSLHNKSLFVQFEDENCKCISSSCNFAFGDPRHSENMLVIEQCADTEKMFRKYFSLLDKHSLTISDYSLFSLKNYDFEYVVMPEELDDIYGYCYFTGPFLKYNGEGSNHYIQKRIIDFIRKAKNKLYICSQHFSDIEPFDKNALSIVKELEVIAKSNPNLEIKILKQTRAENQKQGTRTLATEQKLKKIQTVEQRYWTPVVHDKFIIVDDKVMVSTANFTSTQFAWAEKYPMKYEVVEEGKIYTVENTFSEVNSFHFINDKYISTQYENHFNNLWDKSITL